MGGTRKSYGEMYGSFEHDTSGGPPDSMGQYCGSHVKIQDGKAWRWSSDNKEWYLGNNELITIERHLSTKKSSNSKLG